MRYFDFFKALCESQIGITLLTTKAQPRQSGVFLHACTYLHHELQTLMENILIDMKTSDMPV